MADCPEITLVAPALLRPVEERLWEVSEGDEPEEWGCDLEPGHLGEHWTAVAHRSSADTDVWLCWATGAPAELAERPVCEFGWACEDDAADDWVCFLVVNHPGRHTDGEKRWTDEEAPPALRDESASGV